MSVNLRSIVKTEVNAVDTFVSRVSVNYGFFFFFFFVRTFCFANNPKSAGIIINMIVGI